MERAIERHRVLIVAVAAMLAALPAASRAQGFPSKPIRYVVPFGAGGSPDIVARLIAERLTRLWGQQVIVENRVGVAGTMGTAFVAKSPPDGHTLVQCNVASSGIAVSLFAKMPYDQLRDIAAIARIGRMPNVVTVHPSVPFKSMKELVSYARTHPGKLNVATGLVGTSPQLSMELINLMAKVELTNIPYKIGAQGISDVLAGQLPIGIFNLPSMVAPVQGGRLRGLAVTSVKRASQIPDVPTMQEAGFDGYEVTSWYGVCGPAGIPAPLLEKLHADINTVLGSPELQHRLNELLGEATPVSREEFDQFIRAEVVKWAQVIKDAKIPLQ